MNLFLGILIENFEELSVRQDFINKMHEINKVSFWSKLKETICPQGDNKVQSENKIEDILDEEL